MLPFNNPVDTNLGDRTQPPRPPLAADRTEMHATPAVPMPTPSDEPLAPRPSSLVPNLIPGYEMLGTLGRGGMGVVYKARHLALNRIVAIKIIGPVQQATERELVRFQVEGETVANLQHPNIVQLYQIGEFGGRPFLAFEYVDGGNLAERIAGQPQSPKFAAELTEMLARAVQVAHQQGVLHRDLKPANVLLTKDNVPKIADFGLARRLDRPEHSSEMIAGTASYMSPEQAWGDSKVHPLTPATDVYSLGAILYELFTGRPPFAAESPVQTLKDVWHSAPRAPRLIRPEIPEELEVICLKCLEKEPGRRYASADDLADDLHRYLAHEPITARPSGRFERAWLWCRRDPIFAGLLAMLIFSILAGLGGISRLAWIYRDEKNTAESATILADANAVRADKNAAAATSNGEKAMAGQRSLRIANDRLEHRLYDALILAAAHDSASLDIARDEPHRRQLAARLDQCPPRLRNIEWNLLHRELDSSLSTRRLTANGFASMAFSADGAWAAGTTQMPDLLTGPTYVWNTLGWQPVRSFARPVYGLVFSPDSRLILLNAGKGESLLVWDWQRDVVLRTFKYPPATATLPVAGGDKKIKRSFLSLDGAACFSSNGSRLAIALGGNVELYRPQADGFAKSDPEMSLPTGPVAALGFCSGDDRLIVLANPAASDHSELQLWNAATGKLIRKQHLDGFYTGLAVRGEGAFCAVSAARIPQYYDVLNNKPFPAAEDDVPAKNVLFCDLDSDSQPRRCSLSSHAQSMKFSRDGKTLLAGTEGGRVEVVDVATGQVTASLCGSQSSVVAVDWIGGNILSASKDGCLKTWPNDGKSRSRQMFDGQLPFALSPDGRELAIALPGGAVRRFDVETDRRLPGLSPLPFRKKGQTFSEWRNKPASLHVGGLTYLPQPEKPPGNQPGKLLVGYSDLGVRTWQLVDVEMSPPKTGSIADFNDIRKWQHFSCRVLSTVQLALPGGSLDADAAQALGYWDAHDSQSRIIFSSDGRYAGWPGIGPRAPIEPPSTTLLVWEARTGRIIVEDINRSSETVPGMRLLDFFNSGGHSIAVLRDQDPWLGIGAFPLGVPKLRATSWDLTTGKRLPGSSADSLPLDEIANSDHSRLIRAEGTDLIVVDAETGLDLLHVPLNAVAKGPPRLSTDGRRLAVPTDKGITVFDVGG